MQEKSLKSQVVTGLFWRFGERIFSQGISFIISLILARLLLPEQYGTISLILVFINLANVFVSEGLGAALVQKKNADDTDFSTMFFCSLGTAVLLYGFLFLTAPWIAAFYENTELIPVIRVIGLQLLSASVQTIQNAYVSKHMMFRKFFFSTLGGTLVSGVVGVVMAYRGMGIWALVAQYLVNSVMHVIVLFFTLDWRPKWKFSVQSAKQMYGYSWKLLFASLINTLYSDLRSLIIGKKYSEADLAYNNKGTQLPSLIITNINTAISSVLFPAMAKVSDDTGHLKSLTRQSLKVTSYVIFPMMIGMFAVADVFVRVLLTEKWIGCVPFLRCYCLYWMFQPCLTANAQAMKAVGRSDVYLKLEVAKKIIGVALVLATMFISVHALAFSNVVFALISTVINIVPIRKMVGYGFREQIQDMFIPLVLSAVMGVCVWGIGLLNIPDLLLLVFQVITGAFVYIAISAIFKVDSFLYILKTVKKLKK